MIIRLPLPPSVNELYANRRRGRFRTAAYADWIRRADSQMFYQMRSIKAETPVKPPTSVHIKLPEKMHGDADNRLKACLDYLASRGLTADDKHHAKVTAEKVADIPDGMCEVVVETMG